MSLRVAAFRPAKDGNNPTRSTSPRFCHRRARVVHSSPTIPVPLPSLPACPRRPRRRPQQLDKPVPTPRPKARRLCLRTASRPPRRLLGQLVGQVNAARPSTPRAPIHQRTKSPRQSPLRSQPRRAQRQTQLPRPRPKTGRAIHQADCRHPPPLRTDYTRLPRDPVQHRTSPTTTHRQTAPAPAPPHTSRRGYLLSVNTAHC